jgi:hypothetical protein
MMVIEGSGVRGRGSGRVAFRVAILAVVPLLVPALWGGVRLAQSDTVLAAISSAEQPLSVRSAGGVWAIGLALAWFSLAYWHRQVTLWEAALVLVGGAVALARLGNIWVEAVAILVPLGRQLAIANLRPAVLSIGAVGCLGMTLLMLIVSRPLELPPAAAQAAAAAPGSGKILADWRWAGDLQRQVGGARVVLASGGVTSESSEFWLDYVRIADGHERWAAALRQMNVDLVVLTASDQQRPAADLVRGSADWRVIYEANGALVAARTGS